MTQPKVQFADVTLNYGAEDATVEAVCNVNFTVEAGQSVALIGPSGCGKSTVLQMAAGLLTPTRGTVCIDGTPIEKPRLETAFIPQNLGLFPWKTVLQNAALGLQFHGVSRSESHERARAELASVGLTGFEASYPKELSGGMKQRLALARALVIEADLLLMDEPLSAIDALLRESLQDMLLDFWRERHHAQIVVTHSIEEAVYLGQRIIVFSNRPGTVVATIDNPRVGTPNWRDSDEFAHICKEVRAALASLARAQCEGVEACV